LYGSFERKGHKLLKNSQDSHGYGKVFSLHMGKKSTFSRELPEKSTRGHTDFIHGIESSLRRETLCKRRKIIEMRFPR
jgi:hypothetical protein